MEPLSVSMDPAKSRYDMTSLIVLFEGAPLSDSESNIKCSGQRRKRLVIRFRSGAHKRVGL